MKFTTFNERNMQTDIPIVKQNADKLFDNDIVTSLKIGKDAPRIAVRFGDEVPLNTPSIDLTDIPTPEHRADSDFNDLYENVVKGINTYEQEMEKEKKENNPKNE